MGRAAVAWASAAGLALALSAPAQAALSPAWAAASAASAVAAKAGSPARAGKEAGAAKRPRAPESILPKGAEPDPASETRHVVTPGETLGGIAARAEVPRILIIEANGLAAPYGVRAGQVLVIPRRRSHVTKPGETGFAIAMDYGVPWTAIAAANALDPQARVRAGQKLVIPTITKARPAPAAPSNTTAASTTGAASTAAASTAARPADRDDDEGDVAAAANGGLHFVWPAPGKVRRGFAPRRKGLGSSEAWRDMARGKVALSPHDGIDIIGAKGDPVRAAAPGLVWYAGKEPNLYGNVVIIDHGKGWFSAYAKLSRVTVAKGDAVRAGERVGLIGDTGSTPTTELHFEIRRKTVPIDPRKLLPERK